jgi:ATP-binding cassette subfamily B protein
LLCVPVLLAYLICAGELGWAAYHGTITLGTLAVMLPMLPSTMNVGSVSIADYRLEGMLSALPDLDALTSGLVETPFTGSAAIAGGSIAFENVTFRYSGKTDVLHDLSLELTEGRSLAVVGVNGAGKTTLVSLLARLRDPVAGRITVGGVPLTDLPAREWQRRVAVVYQDFARLPLTARENITIDIADARVDDEALARALRQSGAAEVIEGLPKGLDTVLSPQYTMAKTSRAASGNASRWLGPCMPSSAARPCASPSYRAAARQFLSSPTTRRPDDRWSPGIND